MTTPETPQCSPDTIALDVEAMHSAVIESARETDGMFDPVNVLNVLDRQAELAARPEQPAAPLMQSPERPKSRISRRTALIGAGLAITALGTGILTSSGNTETADREAKYPSPDATRVLTPEETTRYLEEDWVAKGEDPGNVPPDETRYVDITKEPVTVQETYYVNNNNHGIDTQPTTYWYDEERSSVTLGSEVIVERTTEPTVMEKVIITNTDKPITEAMTTETKPVSMNIVNDPASTVTLPVATTETVTITD